MVEPELGVTTVPIGQGDSTVIHCPTSTGDVSIIDMGCFGGCPDMTIKQYVHEIEFQFLAVTPGNQAGYRKLKRVFLTHADADHVNYAYDGKGNGLLEKYERNWEQGVTPLDVYIGNYQSWSVEKPALVNFLNNSPAFKIRSDSNWQAVDGIVQICSEPDATIKIIASDLGSSKNAKSMIMSLRIKDSKLTHKKMLFLGDFESSYDILLSAYLNEIRDHDIVMIPHHGAASNGNPNKNFYELVKPTYAIVSAEIDSNNKHPKMETLQAICRTPTEAVEPRFPNNDPNEHLKPMGWIKNNAGVEDVLELLYCDVKIYQTYTLTGPPDYKNKPYYIDIIISATTTNVRCEDP